jgi:hypothetical protein
METEAIEVASAVEPLWIQIGISGEDVLAIETAASNCSLTREQFLQEQVANRVDTLLKSLFEAFHSINAQQLVQQETAQEEITQ